LAPPPVPPVKPTKAVAAPTSAGMSTRAEAAKDLPVAALVMVQARVLPS
jgi:hypothetical protein